MKILNTIIQYKTTLIIMIGTKEHTVENWMKTEKHMEMDIFRLKTADIIKVPSKTIKYMDLVSFIRLMAESNMVSYPMVDGMVDLQSTTTMIGKSINQS